MLLASITTPSDALAASSPLADPQGSGLIAALEARGHEWRSYEVPAGESLRDTLAQAAALGRRLAARFARGDAVPDVLLCDGVISGIAAHAAAVVDRRPVVVWTGSLDLPEDPGFRRLSVAVLRSAQLICASSGALATSLESRRLGAITVVPPSVDLATFQGSGWRDRTAGRARPVAVVVEPDTPAPVRVADVLATALGTGERGDVPALDIRRITGHDPVETARALREADLAVTGLVDDGGRSTLRAMACAVPVVVLARLPDREIVVPGTSGLLVRSVSALPQVLGELARDPFQREALGQGALDRVLGAHSPQVVSGKLEATLRQVLSTAPGGGVARARPAS